ncbi:MAG: PfkB family carbohydrate kinase [Verrucomicrobiales bacterium]|nr:PfkB family carbohydrate kinase [Verrucomicrobiales bacterium]
MSLLDTIQVVDDFPSGTGVTEVKESTIMGGGPVPTALCAAARLGAKTAIIDRVGNDWRGELIARDYQKFGVDLTWFMRELNHSSSMGTVLVRKSDGERHLIFQEGTAPPLDAIELPLEALKQCKILHLNGRHWPACLKAAAIVKKAGGLVSFDGGANRYDPKFRELLQMVDILIVASDFAARYSKSSHENEQLASLSEGGARIVGITKGTDGSWFRNAEGATFHQPAFKLENVVDTTGCGDVFHGAFLFAVNAGENWKRCAALASAAAALSAKALGGRGNLPGFDEVSVCAGG